MRGGSGKQGTRERLEEARGDEVVEVVAHLTLGMVRSVKGRRVAERLERGPGRQPPSSTWCPCTGWMLRRELGHQMHSVQRDRAEKAGTRMNRRQVKKGADLQEKTRVFFMSGMW